MNALNNKEVGKYINEYFVSSFQKVATFKIVGNQKQGGNVAAYFCAPDGRVLHIVAGPVDAATMLNEAKWVVESTKKVMEEAKGDVPLKTETSYGDYGTQVHFEDSPTDAAKAAKKDGKLVMVLHISGHFEDPGLT